MAQIHDRKMSETPYSARRRVVPSRYQSTSPYTFNDINKPYSKARHWVWVIVCTVFLALIGVLSDFVGKCRASLCFESIWWKLSVMTFLLSMAIAGYTLYLTRESTTSRPRMIWRKYRLFGILAIMNVISCLAFFTKAIWPAYNVGAISFVSLAALFMTNVGCIILY